MKKRIFLLNSLFLLFLTGCWDSVELNEVSIVSGMAIEKGKEKKFKLSVEVINASEFAHGGGMGDTPGIVYSLEGDSISELSDKMNKGFVRKLIYSHTRVVIIDEKIAKEGIVSFFDFLERSGEIRNDFNIIVAKGVKASDIIKTVYPVRKSPSLKIHYQAETFFEEWGGDPHLRLTDFIEGFVSKGRHPVAAAVTIEGNPEKGYSTENNKKTDLDAQVVFEGMAVFKNDSLLGFLDIEDTRNFLWVRELEKTTVTVPCSEKEEDKNKYIDLKITHSKPERKVNYEGDTPVINVEIKAEANLQGTQCGMLLTEMSTYKEHEKSLSKFIEEEIKETIEKVQDKYGVDIFGFGEDLKRSDYKKFKEVEDKWDEEFSRAVINVEAKAFIRRSGIRNDSFITEMEKKE
ncbi:Ger(x)C family spore germination protein [Litchfieldia salsa]|uniref:Spore germination protein KC n=1 Tax=Litchfieldia salsa TaxID=930152 RepID=A0A1H0TEK5_9BACI|nr:Ger(x)C family spore germination protein [Litchfieldia salsa]SDP52434.1 spore germination protein KC [Litchfieldia salsa]